MRALLRFLQLSGAPAIAVASNGLIEVDSGDGNREVMEFRIVQTVLGRFISLMLNIQLKIIVSR